MASHPFSMTVRLRACLLLLPLAACGETTAPFTRVPGIHVAPGTILADTVLATPTLTVLMVDSSGSPARGQTIRFEIQQVVDPRYGFRQHPLYLTLIDSTAAIITAVTNLDGEATVQAHLMVPTDSGLIVMAAPGLGYLDTLVWQIRPGGLGGVVPTPRDTAVYANKQFMLTAHTIDRSGFTRHDPVSFSVLAGPALIDASSGMVSTTGIGRVLILERAGAFSDTAFLSVVPQAWIATQQFDPGNGGPVGIFLTQLDGSGRQRLTSGLDNSFIPHGFGWSPDGLTLALGRGRSIMLLTPGGAETPLIEMVSAVLPGTRYARDGQWIYFAGHGGLLGDPEGLYRVSVNGVTVQHLGTAGTDYAPSPSHDGAAVAYLSYRSPCGVDECIRVLDLATNTDRRFGNQDYLAKGSSVAWSPTQDLIAWESGRQLMLSRSDGTQARLLANLETYIKWMDWSPDGRWLVVAEIGVWLYDTQTGLRLPLAPFTSYGATVWRP
jgi:hypothetical protein